MLEFACHTWTFTDLTLPEALGTIARLGFRYVDIGSGNNLNVQRAAENPRKLADEIRADLELFNLKLSDLYLMLPHISSTDDSRRQKDLELFQKLVPFAAALGTPGITVSPGLAPPLPKTPAKSAENPIAELSGVDPVAWERTVNALNEMLKSTKGLRMRLSIEPHMDSIAAKPEDALKLLKAVPGLELTLDWAHLVCQDVFHDDIAALIPYARHIQVRQAARAQLQTPFNQGRVDIKKLVKDVLAAQYAGVICVEYMTTVGWHGMLAVNTIQESARMRDALRDARQVLVKKADSK
jgi:sugar phosphate isomerase/epimerase